MNKKLNEMKQKEDKPKVKYYHVIPVKVSGVMLKLTPDKRYLIRIKLITDIGDITHKPKKWVNVNESLAGFDVEISDSEYIEITEFILANPMLVMLSKESKKTPQEIWLSYAEIEGVDNEGVSKKYKFMGTGQFKNIFYEEFHKEDKTTLNKMKETKEKFSEVELSEEDINGDI